MFVRKPNVYYKENDYYIGTLGNGQKYKVDAEDYYRIKDYTCYPNKTQVSIRVNGKMYQLKRFILGACQKLSSKVMFISDDWYDFRKANLISGNKYINKGDYMEVYDQKLRMFLIDVEDYDKVKKYIWYVDPNGYVVSSRGNNGRAMKIHRLIMDVLDKPNIEIDHIHHNLRDNRKSELRTASRSENCINRQLEHLNNSGTIGVYQHSNGAWCAQINYDKKHIYLGYYNTYEDAVAARKAAEKLYHKGFSPRA